MIGSIFGFGRNKRKKPETRLAGLLREYPAATPPFPLSNGAVPQPGKAVLKPEQAQANLDWHKEVMPHRLELLANLLSEFNLDMDDAWSPERRRSMLAARDEILVDEFRAVATPETIDPEVWECSDRAGSRIVHTLLHDLAMLDQEIFIRAIPGAYVGLNTDKRDRQMAGYLRPALKGTIDRRFPAMHFSFDDAHDWHGFFRRAASGSPTVVLPFDHPGHGMLRYLEIAIRDPDAKN